METGWYESVSLSDYFGVIARRKWIVLLVTVLMTVSAVAYSKNQTPKYQATASLPSPQSQATEAKNGGVTWSQVHAPLADTTKNASIVVGARPPDAIPAVGTLHPQPPAFNQVKTSGMTADELLSSSSVLPAATGDSIEFTVTATDATLAKQLAKSWAEVYGASLLNDAELRNATSWNAINRILHPPKDPTTGVAPPGPPANVAKQLQDNRADVEKFYNELNKLASSATPKP